MKLGITLAWGLRLSESLTGHLCFSRLNIYMALLNTSLSCWLLQGRQLVLVAHYVYFSLSLYECPHDSGINYSWGSKSKREATCLLCSELITEVIFVRCTLGFPLVLFIWKGRVSKNLCIIFKTSTIYFSAGGVVIVGVGAIWALGDVNVFWSCCF